MSPPECWVWVRQREREMREGIWYNNMKGLEGREFNDECAFTEPWLCLWAWNCPSAMEQQPGLSIRTSPTWSVESGWINGIGGRFSHESSVFRQRMRSLALWERRDVVRLTHKHVAWSSIVNLRELVRHRNCGGGLRCCAKNEDKLKGNLHFSPCSFSFSVLSYTKSCYETV